MFQFLLLEKDLIEQKEKTNIYPNQKVGMDAPKRNEATDMINCAISLIPAKKPRGTLTSTAINKLPRASSIVAGIRSVTSSQTGLFET